MNTRYLLNGLVLSDKEKSYLESKVAKIEKFLKDCKDPNALRLEIDIKQDKKKFWTVEIMLKTPKQLFRVEKVGKTFMIAVDEADDALMKQLRRHKDKMIALQRKNK
jgi:ribosomal subunit interface protein